MTGNAVIAYCRKHLPTRESIAANRWLAPFADRLLRPDLWRLNRRSVPRGVALGIFAGILVPFAHTLIAALVAVPVRANIFIAICLTWVSNPFTWIFLFPLESEIGRFVVGFRKAAPAPEVARQATTAVQGWLSWLLHTSGQVALGSLVLATGLSAAAYFLSALLWRLRVARKWRRRHA